ncbi:MAG: hypothetical protein M3Z08_02365 [Chloroflexota bacterium]|nr:hypothetical protein [Chloroflexota bacterium]
MTLLTSTGNVHVDRLLSGLIGIFEAAFPARVQGYYVQGSYADRSGVATSDIDIEIVFRGSIMVEERQKAELLADYCADLSGIELDAEVEDEERLMAGSDPMFKMASLLIYGEDIRDRVLLVGLQDWIRDRMHTSYWRFVNLFQRPGVVTYPLTYPDPTAEFYGYELRKVRLPDGREVNSTRDLIRSTGWAATAIIAFKCGRYVARKSDCHRIYQECFHDQWGTLLTDIYEQCRGRWHYLIPDVHEERQQLRAICARTPGFENHFLQVYKEFLLSELRHGDTQAREQALKVLAAIPFQDEEILASL